MSLHDDLRRAADPATPLTDLQDLAQNVPEARPAIAENPSTYPALLDWLAEFEDPDIHAALARRSRTAAESSATPHRGTRGDYGRQAHRADDRYDRNYDEDARPGYDEDAQGYDSSADGQGDHDYSAYTDYREDYGQRDDYQREGDNQPRDQRDDYQREGDNQPRDQRDDYQREGDNQPRDQRDFPQADRAEDGGWDPQATSSWSPEQYEDDWRPAANASHNQWKPVSAATGVAPEELQARKAKSAKQGSFWSRPSGVLTIIVAVLLTVIIVVGGIGGVQYAQGNRSSGLGAVVARALGNTERKPVSTQTVAPDDSDNPAAFQRSGTDRAKQALALTDQERVVKDFSKEEEENASNEVRPVPAAAYTDITEFQVDSGGVVCDINAGQAHCIIKKTTGEYGNHGGALSLTITAGGVFAMTDAGQVAADQGSQNAVLAASAAVAQGTIACQSSGSAVECWDATTGHGFTAGGGRVGQF